MITPSLKKAIEHKASSAVPSSIRMNAGQFEVVTKLQTMTNDQHQGLLMAYEWHLAFNRSGDDITFNPIQFEIHGISQKGKGAALANQLRQLGVLQCHNGRFWISPAGLNLVNLLNSENTEY